MWFMMNDFLSWNVSASEVRVGLFCMCSQRSVSLIHFCQSVQPDIYSLTHHLFLPFKHLWKSWVGGEAGCVSSFLSFFSPCSWAASVKPSTPPRRLWRRNMPDVSFTKTNRNHSFKLWPLSSPQCWYPWHKLDNLMYQWWLTVNHKGTLRCWGCKTLQCCHSNVTDLFLLRITNADQTEALIILMD